MQREAKGGILFAVSAGILLLTGCTGEKPPEPMTETTVPAVTVTGTQAVTQTTTATVTEDDTPLLFTVQIASPQTMAPPQTEMVFTTAKTKAVTTVPVQISYKAPIDLTDTLQKGRETALTGKGRVVAPDGLTLRDKPSQDGKKLLSMPHGTEVQILSGTFSSDAVKSFDDSRWYRVKVNGKEGYANAEYVMAKFDRRVSEMTQEQLCAMTCFMYYQEQTLLQLYFYRGGVEATGRDDSDRLYNDDPDAYYEYLAAVTPKTMTLDSLKASFYEYFYKPHYMGFFDDVNEFGYHLTVRNGKIYCGTTENMNTVKWKEMFPELYSYEERHRAEQRIPKRDGAYRIEALSDREISLSVYSTKKDMNTEKLKKAISDSLKDEGQYDLDVQLEDCWITLKYDDGHWKYGDDTMMYELYLGFWESYYDADLYREFIERNIRQQEQQQCENAEAEQAGQELIAQRQNDSNRAQEEQMARQQWSEDMMEWRDE